MVAMRHNHVAIVDVANAIVMVIVAIAAIVIQIAMMIIAVEIVEIITAALLYTNWYAMDMVQILLSKYLHRHDAKYLCHWMSH